MNPILSSRIEMFKRVGEMPPSFSGHPMRNTVSRRLPEVFDFNGDCEATPVFGNIHPAVFVHQIRAKLEFHRVLHRLQLVLHFGILKIRNTSDYYCKKSNYPVGERGVWSSEASHA